MSSANETQGLLAGQHPQPPQPTFRRGLARHFQRGAESLKKLTKMQIVLVFCSVSLVIFGNIGQLLALNMWVDKFVTAEVGGPFTILTVTACTIAAFYGMLMTGWCLVQRQSIRFVFNGVSFGLLCLNGFCNATNGILLVFATGDTPEVLQAILLSTQILWVFLFVKLGFHEKRSYCSPLVLLSFFFSLGGIVLGMAAQFANDQSLSKNRVYWSLLFAAGMIPGALYNVVAAKFLRRYTKEDKKGVNENQENNYDGTVLPADYKPLAPQPHVAAVPVVPKDQQLKQHDGLTVKFSMLFFSGIAQALWMFAFLPVDAIPWFGSNPGDLGAVGQNLKQGYLCTFTHHYPKCESAFWYYVAFNASYFLNYLGSAWLNMYSPALTSIVTQLSSPLGAILLIAFPVLNPQHLLYNIGESIGAAILLTVGVLIYSAWEESTKQEEREREAAETAMPTPETDVQYNPNAV